MRHAIPFLGLLLILGCTPGNGGRRTTPVPSGVVSITYENLSGIRHKEGDLADIEVRVRNGTDQYVLLRKLDPADDTPAMFWQESMEGSLKYVGSANIYVYDSQAEGETPGFFTGGLLCPSEAITFRLRVRLLHEKKVFTLHYQTYSLAKLPRDIYFGNSLGEGKWHFRPLQGRELRKKLTPIRDTDKPSLRTVIFRPHWTSGKRMQELLEVSMPFTPRAFTLKMAGQKIGVEGGTLHWTYFTAFNQWVIQQKKTVDGKEIEKAWLVGPRESHEVAVSRRPGSVYQFLDMMKRRTFEVQFTGRPWTIVPGVKVLETERRGKKVWVAFVPKEKMLDFLRNAGEYGLTLDVLPGLPSGRILVFDPED